MNANAFAFFSSSTSPIFAGSTCSHHPSPVRYASTCIFQQVQFAAVSFSIPMLLLKSRAGGTAQIQSRCFCSSSEPKGGKEEKLGNSRNGVHTDGTAAVSLPNRNLSS
ncbi:hypothetical protein TYRP_006505 [Tyrophagus putrescentiae]|nr:hypothetical protein TYRP_006505 [Tyrophagus putrescentiae]